MAKSNISINELTRLSRHLDEISIYFTEQGITNISLKKTTDDWRKYLVRYIDEPEELHETEKNCPEQTEMLRNLLDEMYQIHLRKNADYSPYNIRATGMHGIMTRIWDKTARLMNLMGFNIGTGEYTGEKEAMDESVEQNFMDASHYFLIALIFRAGKWGK
jgi:hypothetical protein